MQREENKIYSWETDETKLLWASKRRAASNSIPATDSKSSLVGLTGT